ncbi:MAG: pitrilysin family protein [Phycisphaeraceae bacterium]
MTQIHTATLPAGLTLLGEQIPAAQSLSMSLLTPAGLAQQADDQQGVATLLEEMICRGAGGLSAREHSEALDRLGVRRSTSVETRHMRLSATMIGEKLPDALPLLVDMIRRPNLDADGLEPARLLSLQSLESLEDEPQQRVMLELKRRHFPAPFDRSPFGQRDALTRLTLDDVRAFWKHTAVPAGSVLAFAGRFDWDELHRRVAELLGDWQGELAEPAVSQTPPRGYEHLTQETAQVHIALAYDAPAEPEPESPLQRAATAVLSGGMSGRLFTEVREKRGLCYAVGASYAGQRDRGAVFSYAGTTTPRAQETLDVLTHELRRLSEGIDEDEYSRAIVGMKSRLVMQGESTAARAGAIAHDQAILGHPRSLDELRGEVDAITLERLNAYVSEHPPGRMTIVTLGPTKLSLEAQPVV